MFKNIFYFIVFLPSFVLGLNKYNIEFEIDFQEKLIKGKTLLTFTNTYNFPIKNLYFNLYQNAFRKGSTLWKEDSFLKNCEKKYGQDCFSYTNINKIIIENEKIEFNFISPDDGNVEDKTLIEVPLPSILFPENSISIEIFWETKLHKYYFRSGFTDETLFLMQWYPKLSVFEEGKWRIHQAHLNTEFYGEFSDFEIGFKIPIDWNIVSTGKIAEEKLAGEKIIKIVSENVHDVAIVISKELKKIKKNINIMPDNPVEINIFIPPEYQYKAPRIMDILERCFKFYNEWVGPYLYSNFSIVFPTWNAVRGSAGMEYPQLIICGIKHFDFKKPLELEYVIAHEFAHQYFYGLLASNEVEEPWLDEGFTTYISSTLLEKEFLEFKIYPPLILGLAAIKPIYWNAFEVVNLNYYRDDGIGQFALAGYLHPNYLSYRIYAYNKPAMALKTLEKYVGEKQMKMFLQDYYSSFSFLHPHTDDVISLIEKNFGRLWAENFYNLSYKPQLIDYEVEIISEGKFIIKRYGEFYVPVEILIFFNDGSKEKINWDGLKKFQIFFFENKKIKKIIIDPERKILLDLNPLNNISNYEEKKAPFLTFFFLKITLLLESLICWF